ncbi:phage shock protein C (PspC) family protein [Roseivirga ehrenbergii]|uniref:Stress-responsive transcriptional regulator n=3 Tax=Roseivirga TaxID=290180 RepID=A0A0L8AIZ6_9BACT|nr:MULTISPECIES: PspC domain-containing protein [Roseivirga]KOF02211.1 stress-responsive transcriptional regulator [Roseivirga seohaensis subsp. aquiponti]KYG72004.1 stress-responsive transcriptional regulator [Roseivirga ehrenbergii]KYG80903.1 stress-responsive transcriptional regulator [Roseivirga seohaensis]TCL13222.1 phage shock protein C (PspC) family protein [Roseivirga ehrenbergii]|tara:strand:+ start:1158 stop:1346 length:189 start_codon:yes stop_codon:yes gene_type:complete
MSSNKKLKRTSDKVIAGVCGGLAEWLGWDVSLVRVLYVFATIFTAFSGLLVYIVLWIVMPQE